MRTRRGATLLELLITVGVFALLMVAMFVVQRIGTDSWRDVNAKSDVTNDLHRFEADIITEVQRAYGASVNVLTKSTDYRWALWFQTPMNDPTFVGVNGVPKMALGDPLSLITDGNGTAVPQRWVLYYVMRMDSTEHVNYYGGPCASYGVLTGPDTTCPHKWIVKKDISAVDGSGNAITLTSANISPYLTDLVDSSSITSSESGLAEEANNASYPSAPGVPGSVQRTRIVMRNVVSFELARLALDPVTPSNPPVASATGPIILFDVKAFKLLDAQKSVSVGLVPMVNVNKDGNDNVLVSPVTQPGLTTQEQTSASVLPKYQHYTVQVDTRVIPEN